MSSSLLSVTRESLRLEVIGFLTFGIMHKLLNGLARIRLLSEFGFVEAGAEGRDCLREITGEVDGIWSRQFLKTWLTGTDADSTRVFLLDTGALRELGSIVQTSFRHYALSYVCSVEEGIHLSATPLTLGQCMVLPAARFCTAWSGNANKGACSTRISASSEGLIHVHHRFPHVPGLPEVLEQDLQQFGEQDIRPLFQSNPDGDSLDFFLALKR